VLVSLTWIWYESWDFIDLWKFCPCMLEAVSVFPGNDIFFETMKKFHKKIRMFVVIFQQIKCQGTTQAFYLLGAQFFLPKKCGKFLKWQGQE